VVIVTKKSISIKLSPHQIDRIKRLKTEGRYPSVTNFIETAVERQLAAEEIGEAQDDLEAKILAAIESGAAHSAVVAIVRREMAGVRERAQKLFDED
jgi:Arc/MetJ-type ribon-helix-helix transcriptional regulator